MDWRWDDLKPVEKRICFMYCIERRKAMTIAKELGISRGRIWQRLEAIYRVIGVTCQVELAFEMGRHWNEIGPAGTEDK